jgi:hypothetical protein
VKKAFINQRKKRSKRTVWSIEMVWSDLCLWCTLEYSLKVYCYNVWACCDSVLLSMIIGWSTEGSSKELWQEMGWGWIVCRTWSQQWEVRLLLLGDLKLHLIWWWWWCLLDCYT